MDGSAVSLGCHAWIMFPQINNDLSLPLIHVWCHVHWYYQRNLASHFFLLLFIWFEYQSSYSSHAFKTAVLLAETKHTRGSGFIGVYHFCMENLSSLTAELFKMKAWCSFQMIGSTQQQSITSQRPGSSGRKLTAWVICGKGISHHMQTLMYLGFLVPRTVNHNTRP
jgi:hypothetical protein